MTVAAMIAALQTMPPDALVYVEGDITPHCPALSLAPPELVEVWSDRYAFDPENPTEVTVVAWKDAGEPTTQAVLISVASQQNQGRGEK